MTNYEKVKQLSKTEMAHIFHKLALDGADESDWLEWMDFESNENEWKMILN